MDSNKSSITSGGVLVRTETDIASRVAQRVEERNKFLIYGKNEQGIQNGWDFVTKALPEFVKFRLPTEQYRNENFPIQSINWETLNGFNQSDDIIGSVNHSNAIQTTWIGHSTVLLQMDQCTIITDPVFSDRASPYGKWVGPKRLRPTPCSVHDMMSKLQQHQQQQDVKKSSSPIDVVLISHNHFDHLDYCSVRDIVSYCNNNKCPKPVFVVPLGLRKWFQFHVSSDLTIYEMDWYETIRIPKVHGINHNRSEMSITCLPMRHWSSRIGIDRDKTLWCGYKVATSTTTTTTTTSTPSDSKSFLFAGDTAWFDELDSIVGKQYGPYDVAAIPIGAYEPREFMKTNHINPVEAVAMKDAIQARYAVPIHYGTFPLTTEPYMDPVKQLLELMKDRADQQSFLPWHVGETRSFQVNNDKL